MRTKSAAILLSVALAVTLGSLPSAEAEEKGSSPNVVKQESLTFSGPPALPGLSAAWAIGSESGSGLYALRVKLKAGGKLPPHTHPDARLTTVLSGTLSIGFGESFDESTLVTAHAGDSYLVPAGQPHFIVARDGDVEYQEVGSGKTGTEMVKR